MSKPKASPIKASRRTFPVEVLWCGNLRQGSGKGWSFPPNVEKFLRAVGLRADEETREGIYGDAVTCDYPFQRWRWGLEDVLRCLRRRSITVPERTDCAWCYDQQLIEWYRLWLNHRDVWNEGKEHEARTGKTFRSPSRDTWPAALAEMEKEFEAGRIPQVRASRGGGTCRVCSL